MSRGGVFLISAIFIGVFALFFDSLAQLFSNYQVDSYQLGGVNHIEIASKASDPQAEQESVLFIGNSHVFVNHVPALVSDLSQDCAGKSIWFRSSLVGGKTLNWHYNNQRTQECTSSPAW